MAIQKYDDNRTIYKTISINEALAISKEYGKCITIATLITWIDTHVPKLGHQPGGNNGRWYIFQEAFIAFISGQESVCNDILMQIANQPKEADKEV
jgi:hypothetical protein